MSSCCYWREVASEDESLEGGFQSRELDWLDRSLMELEAPGVGRDVSGRCPRGMRFAFTGGGVGLRPATI